MLTKKTVLVLGAGASEPFGFPTGIQLSQQVYEKLEPPHTAHHWLTGLCGYTVDQVAQFRRSFFLSGKNSVDAFLEYRDDYMQIGKAAMAAILIPYEHEWHLFRYDQGWLRYLFNNLNTSFEDFGKNELSIITFNYDRTVEHFIFTALKNTYNKTDDEVRAVVEQIPIIHLHGRLGFLPWQGGRSRAYGVEVDKHALDVSIENIKIIHEDIKGRDDDFTMAKALLDAADQILFMGFGYNKTNMDRLEIGKIAQGKAWGTNVGLGNRELGNILTNCGSRIQFFDGDCLEIIRERVAWE
jgi:hypothetical protein